MEQFLELTERADFPYISCNFTKEDEPVFAPYVIKEAAGMKIAFVGITTPKSLTSSTPKYFQNEAGEYIYGFSADDTGEKLYQAVQTAVDDARAEGAEYVYVMAHLGLEEAVHPYTYADVISNTNGIDVFLDGHSHDTEQVVMKNKDGEDVVRSAVGTKLSCIGHSLISPEEGIVETAIWSWPNNESMPSLVNIRNEIADKVDTALAKVDSEMNEEVGSSSVALTIYDPNEKDASGNPIRMVRRAETNLGDFCADAVRIVTGADIGICNGGGVRKNIDKGTITYGNIISVHPFGNEICVVEVTGQQILDALELGASSLPDEMGGFLQVSGLSYEVDVAIPSGCQRDENNMFIGVEGERRVKNVMVGDEPIDPAKTYTLAGTNYTLLEHGDGQTAFDGATLLENGTRLDYQVLIEYITDNLGGEIGEEYADPYGQGRIKILNG
jgi:2',3'-cyclic-nucleotide 2'-phosphodiesterase (5'-nucleotidase family)